MSDNGAKAGQASTLRGWAARESGISELRWANVGSRGIAAVSLRDVASPCGTHIQNQHLMQPTSSAMASFTAAWSHIQTRASTALAFFPVSPATKPSSHQSLHEGIPLPGPRYSPSQELRPFASITSTTVSPSLFGAAPPPPAVSPAAAAAAAAKAEVGRATWTLLHTLAAQFPDRPTRQQQRDARTLVECLTRIYPCGDCARHFAELVRLDPPVVSSGPTFRLWLCRMHNRVNARLGKPTFNCDLVERRWAPLGCSAEEEAAGEAAGRGGGVSDPGCQLLGVGSRWTGGIRR